MAKWISVGKDGIIFINCLKSIGKVIYEVVKKAKK